MSEERGRVVLLIEGRVQGVFYRASALEEAQRLGISGWVRNLPDGAVEAVAEGRPDALEAFVAWCREGPPMARVDQVHVRREAPRGEFRTFEIRR